MLYRPIQLEFSGFQPEYETHGFISSIADRLHALAPSDSFMSVVMKRGRDAIVASCRIVSKAGVFATETVGNWPKAVIRQIEKKIMQQLDEWKKNRFGVETPKIERRFSRPQLEIAI